MSVSIYQASIPVFNQILNSMDVVLSKAKEHADNKKIDHQALLQARLFPDMFNLIRQVQIACDFAKGASARLAGLEVPAYEDHETSFEQLHARIEKTLQFINGIKVELFEGAEVRDIVVGSGEKQRQFKGQQYLLHYVLPHFYFHATTTYAILRHNGVEVGKRDFIGKID